MTSGQVIYALVLMVVAVLPIVFRKNRALCVICVMAILLNSLAVVHFGVRLAARNVPLPSPEQLRSEVVYSEAWSAGRMSTQHKIDAYLPIMALSFVLLAILALVPLVTKPGESGASLKIKHMK